AMLADSDQRVIPAVLESLVKLQSPKAAAILLERLKVDDPVVRSAAATGLGTLKPSGGAAALAEAYAFGQRDPSYNARAAALGALASYGLAAAAPVLKTAFADKDWAVRVRAARLMVQLDPATAADTAAQLRPAPQTLSGDMDAA